MSRPLKHFGASGSGLRCSHGSDLDTRIARPKQPKTALPPSLRRKMGLAPRKEEDEAASEAIYKAGAGVLKPTGSAPDGTYLKRNSGVPASQRASALAQRSGYASNARATVRRPALADGKNIGEDYGASSRAPQQRRKKFAMSTRKTGAKTYQANAAYDTFLG